MKNFLVSILRSNDFVNHSNTNAVGANLPRANKAVILTYKTIMPDIQILKEYSRNIEFIELQKNKVAQNMIASQALFHSLLQQAFSGELVA
jgi:restriction endonuclease S subunit